MNLKKLREELKEKILGFEVTKYLLESGSIRSDKQKEDMVSDTYKKLEKWIFDTISNVTVDDTPEPTSDPEDTTMSLDF